ncbi:MAG: hypothetical protein AVDCRST_MAG61-2579 [uncultured Friedmanniella sp.]|uniref:DUF3105 domain-containing protein n=1 Tax=uncultured Friedmanniella sp. TaxID=335381 RepID=A0A6J4L715_9ACTN|nr:DUF3105 domain-containing protein [uncultured Friedmanniella sp.]CAA9325609.1 MAG: hypothetical protein AVDCRST_MAG61-2579 [uncultured Friedmanniella sp.]
MAKSPKPAPGVSRRDRLASFEAARKAEQRRRTLALFLICGVLALALLAYPLYLFVDDYRARNATITEFGPAAAAAGCDPVATEPATGSQDHVPEGTEVTYERTPPSSGQHYASPAPFTKHFYSTADRPAVETLVHNLEHGYTIAWYRADAPEAEVDALSDIAKTFSSDDYNPADKFIAAPWTEEDGGGFPEGKNVVLAHWAVDPAAPSDPTKQQGVQQACAQVSGAAIADFMTQFPASSSPEPNGA